MHYPQQRSGWIRDRGLGLIHIYYGQGAGKTSRAVGLAIRAAGDSLRVDFVQFMKSGTSGEVAIFNRIPNIHYWCPGKHPFIMSRGAEPVHHEHAAQGLKYAREAIERGTNLLICDEILDTLIFKLFPKEQLLELVENCRRHKIELVMTGRSAPPELIEAADYVTEFVYKKHPYYNGSRARKGIEY
ncbi:MAG: cob(I)yrinic acid a,c-diamide adenosyltransferase [Desulfobacterales bacterium]|nr:MAG: cob(I)yrinic acid a,c-diamide adenosyltransferase [Desulfobacterales bacterium]